jgi:DNA polymerase-1|tara:strand:+ start:137 stop:856 length:720 start_codon:yes stop_codon:yes gene_type:complete
MKLLIDADYIVYKSCAAAEYDIDWGDDVIMVGSKFSEAYNGVKRDLDRISGEFFDSEVILFFSDSTNFRKRVAPDYKGHRNRKKPCGYRRVIYKLHDEYKVIRMPELEADDAMGIYATSNDDCVVVSPDKDMKQIPGRLYNMEEMFTIDKQSGWEWFLIQTLAGDSTDGYSGAPGFGIKTSQKFFAEYGYTWNSVVRAFIQKGLTEEDALRNARLAKILTADDYDNGPILFNPSTVSSY